MTATVRDLLAMKNSAVVFTCTPETSVYEACRVLRDRRVGCLVVVRGAEVQGLLSERDVVVRVVAEGLDPAATRVQDVMARQVATVPLDARCPDVDALLRERRASTRRGSGSARRKRTPCRCAPRALRRFDCRAGAQCPAAVHAPAGIRPLP